VRDLERENQSLRQQLARLKDDYALCDDEIRRLKALNRGSDGDLEGYKTKIKNLERQLRELQDALNQAGQDDDKVIRRLRAEITALTKELAYAQKESEMKIQELEDELKRLRRETEGHRGDSKHLHARIRELEHELQGMKERHKGAACEAKQQQSPRMDLDRDDLSLIRRAVERMRKREMHKCFNAYRDYCARRRYMTNLILRVRAKWTGDQKVASFSKWRDYAEAMHIRELEFQAYLTKTKSAERLSPRSSGRRR